MLDITVIKFKFFGGSKRVGGLSIVTKVGLFRLVIFRGNCNFWVRGWKMPPLQTGVELINSVINQFTKYIRREGVS